MRQWFIGTNNYWFTASIILEKSPFVLIAIEWLAMHICNALSLIRLDRVHDLWHIFVCSKTTDLLYKYTETLNISMPYFYLKEESPEDFGNDYEYDEELVEANRQEAVAYSSKHKELARKYRDRIDELMEQRKHHV